MEFLLPLFVVGATLLTIAALDLLVYAALALTAVSTVYSYQQQQKAAKDQLKSGGVEITRQDSNAGLTIIYGERAIGGVKVWKDVNNTTFAINSGRTVFGQGDATDGIGKNFKLNAWLNRVDVLGQGPVHGITDIEIEDDSYLAPRFRKRNQAIYRGVFMNGEESQANLTELANNSDWKASSVGSGVAYMYSRFRSGHLDDNKIDRYYSAEPNMRYHLKGRLIWDPRDGAQSSSDPSTWQWSDNPALCLLDYLTQPYGRNLDYSELDIPSFEAAADSCDITVTIPSNTNNTGGTITAWNPVTGQYEVVESGGIIPNFRVGQVGTTQKRLTCNAALDPSTSVLENVKILLQSMRGTLPYYNGTYSLKLEDVEPTSISFTEDDIIGGIRFAQGDRSKRYNRTTVVFKNRNKKYKEDRVSWPALDSAEYATLLAEDNNEELFYEIGLDAVTDYYQAEDLAEFITMSSREQLAAEMQVKSKGMLLEPGDVIEVTHETPGWSARKFRVRSVKFNTDQTVNLALTEYNAHIYTWRDTSQEPLQEDIGLSSPFDDKNPVTSLAATVSRVDTASGVPQGQVELSFTAPEGEQVSEYIVRFKPTGTAVWIENKYPPTQNEVTDVVTVSFLTPQHDTTYDLEVNYLDVGGMSGESAVSSFTVPEYRTDLDLDLNTIETEVGEILEREDGGDFIPSDLSDLAYYYKASELTLQGNIDSLTLSSAANLASVQSSLEAEIDTVESTVSALTTTVANNATTAQSNLDAAVDTLNTTIDAVEQSVTDVETDLATQVATLQSNINTANSNASTSDANLQSQIDGLQTTVTDITAATADVYLQDSAPVAGVDGVPNPIPDNSRWYDSDDSNHPYVWDGTSWVSIKDGQVGTNQAAIMALQASMTDAETDIDANASAISTLDTTVTSLDGTVTSNSADITTLQNTVDDPTTGVAATASAVGTLQTTVSQHGTDITTNATDITALETTVNDPTTGVVANTSAIGGLDTRVTTAEGDITANATDITALETTVNDPTTGVAANASAASALDTRVTAAEGSITTNASDITSLETTVNDPTTGVAANASAASALDTRVTAAEGSITTNASDITSLETTVNDPSTGVSANATAISGIDTRVTTAEGTITAHTTEITALENTVFDPATGVSANTTAISGLDTRITTAEGSITTNASDITALETTVNDPTTGVAANASAASSLDTRVTTAEGTISVNSSDITDLETTVNDPTTGVAANASGVSSLDTRVTAAEGTITSNSTDITALETTVNHPSTGVTATSTALGALTTRVTTAEGDIDANTSDITSLTTTVEDPTTGVAATATGLSNLETRVTATEDVNTSQASDITTLNADLDFRQQVNEEIGGIVTDENGDIIELENDISIMIAASSQADQLLDTRVTATEQTIESQSTDITSLQSRVTNNEAGVSGNSTAITALTTRVTTAEGTITSHSSDITQLQSDLTTTDGNVTANASGLSALTTRVTATEGDIVSNASDITTLQAELDTAELGVAANSSAITGLDTRVTATEGTITSQSSDITALQSTVDDPSTGVAANATAISGLDTRVTAAEGTISTSASAITVLESKLQPASLVWSSGPIVEAVAGSTTISTGFNYPFTPSSDVPLGDGYVHVLLYGADTDDDVRVGYNGSEVGAAQVSGTVNNNAEQWFAFPVTSTTGQQEVDVWNLGASAASVRGIVVTHGGLGDAEGLFKGDENISAIQANATGLTSLTTRVTDAEGDISTNATAITALQSDVTDAESGVSTNATAISGLDTRVTTAEGAITTNSSSITTLQSDLTTAEGDISTNATAISGLDTRVTTAEGSISANSSAITTLSSDLDAAELDIDTNALAISGLDTRVTSAEGTITSQATSLTSLDSRVGTLELQPDGMVTFVQASEPTTDLTEGAIWYDSDDNMQPYVYDGTQWVSVQDPRPAGNATAISGLDTRVTATEGSITSNASDITALQSDVSGLQTDVSGNTTAISGNATAISGLDTRVTTAEGSISSQSTDITSLQSDVSTLQTDVSGNTTSIGTNATAISGLDTRVTVAEGTISSQSTSITNLQSSVTTLETADPEMVVFRQNGEPTTGLVEGAIWYDTDDNNKVYVYNGTIWVAADDSRIAGNASAISGLDTRVTSAEGSITAQATDITALESTVNDPSTGVSATATAVSGLETRVTSTEGDITNLEAEYYVNLDVDGHVTGVRLYNTGTTSSFTVQASEFKVVAPGSSSTEAAPFSVDTSGTISMNASVTINGDLLVDGSITQTQMGNNSVGGDQIVNGSVGANELEISANPGGSGERMFFNGTDNRIEIFDASNVLRVALGDLTGI